MSGRKVMVLVAIAFVLGVGGAALALELLTAPQRTTVDPIQLRDGVRPSDGDHDKKRPGGKKRGDDGKQQGTQTPSGDSGAPEEGAPPAPPAPPAPAGDDDDDGGDDDGGDD